MSQLQKLKAFLEDHMIIRQKNVKHWLIVADSDGGLSAEDIARLEALGAVVLLKKPGREIIVHELWG